jgi:hypothetical protein
MTIGWREQLRPGAALREVIQQETAALVCMDAQHLEELARCCVDLNREIEKREIEKMEKTGEIAEVVVALQDAASDVELLGRVLCETRANITVLSRLHVIRLRETGVLRGGSVDKQANYSTRVLGELNRPERKTEYGDN